MIKNLLVALASLAVLSLLGFGVYAYHSEIDPMTASDSQSFDV